MLKIGLIYNKCQIYWLQNKDKDHKSVMASEANPELARLNCWKIHFYFL